MRQTSATKRLRTAPQPTDTGPTRAVVRRPAAALRAVIAKNDSRAPVPCGYPEQSTPPAAPVATGLPRSLSDLGLLAAHGDARRSNNPVDPHRAGISNCSIGERERGSVPGSNDATERRRRTAQMQCGGGGHASLPGGAVAHFLGER